METAFCTACRERELFIQMPEEVSRVLERSLIPGRVASRSLCKKYSERIVVEKIKTNGVIPTGSAGIPARMAIGQITYDLINKTVS